MRISSSSSSTHTHSHYIFSLCSQSKSLHTLAFASFLIITTTTTKKPPSIHPSEVYRTSDKNERNRKRKNVEKKRKSKFQQKKSKTTVQSQSSFFFRLCIIDFFGLATPNFFSAWETKVETHTCKLLSLFSTQLTFAFFFSFLLLFLHSCILVYRAHALPSISDRIISPVNANLRHFIITRCIKVY